LKIDEDNVLEYTKKLKQSEFYVSLSSIIKKYFNKDLRITYVHELLTFTLIDELGNFVGFSQLSNGEQSLLSMIFTIYGYDLKD
jgi:hypothetical protein